MKFVLLICFLGHILLFSNSDALKYGCPKAENIYPCYCEREMHGPWMYCNYLSKSEQLYDAMKGLKDYKIHGMSFFMNSILDPIKSNAFEGVTAEKLIFKNSTITLTAPQFQGLDELQSLELISVFNKTNPITSLELSHHKNLREIRLERNEITNLSNDWIKEGPDSLRSVFVNENDIVTLEDEVFANIKRLTTLEIEHNDIVTIKRSMFPRPAAHLTGLYLDGNLINYLPDDIFSEMPTLQILELRWNRLTTLDETVWSNIFSIVSKLNLAGNPLECDSNMKWMYTGKKLPGWLIGKCEKPERLRNKNLNQLSLSDFS